MSSRCWGFRHDTYLKKLIAHSFLSYLYVVPKWCKLIVNFFLPPSPFPFSRRILFKIQCRRTKLKKKNKKKSGDKWVIRKKKLRGKLFTKVNSFPHVRVTFDDENSNGIPIDENKIDFNFFFFLIFLKMNSSEGGGYQ